MSLPTDYQGYKIANVTEGSKKFFSDNPAKDLNFEN